jgi:dihydropteroate synthase
VAGGNCAVCVMHMQGQPGTMQQAPNYDDVVSEVRAFLDGCVERCCAAGVACDRLVIDPGFGFGKTVEDQYKMIEEVEHLGFGRFPLLIGISRKSFIYKPLNKKPLEIGEETQILHRKVLEKGAKILRVHDVAETRNLVGEL